MYQSQKSFQMKLYRERPASPNSKLSNKRVTSRTVSLRRLKIHLSANCHSDASGKLNSTSLSKFMITKRLAFQILLIKFQAASIFVYEKRTSWPAAEPLDKSNAHLLQVQNHQIITISMHMTHTYQLHLLDQYHFQVIYSSCVLVHHELNHELEHS